MKVSMAYTYRGIKEVLAWAVVKYLVLIRTVISQATIE